MAASVAGAVVVIGLAHQATPVGKAHVSAEVITHTVAKSDPVTRTAMRDRTDVKHKITPAAAPKAVTTTPRSTTAAATTQQSTTAATVTAQSTSSSAEAVTVTPATTSATPVTSGGS